MTRRWAAFIATALFVAAMFAVAPEQAADLMKALAPLWFVETPQ